MIYSPKTQDITKKFNFNPDKTCNEHVLLYMTHVDTPIVKPLKYLSNIIAIKW